MKNKKLYITLFFLIALAAPLRAANDTTEYTLPQVDVEASPVISHPGLKYNAHHIITESDIKRAPSPHLDAILMQTAGIYVKNYGGLGGLKTVSIRGASASQTLFLIDGMKFNSSQNGSIDLSLIPAEMATKIEVARGGASGLFGGNALAGVVNISANNESKLRFNLGAGSFGEYSFSALATGKIIGVNMSALAGYISSEGDYPFIRKEFGEEFEENRSNSDFRNMYLMYNISGSLSDYKINGRFIYSDSKRGTPGYVSQNHVENKEARYDEAQGTIILTATKYYDKSKLLIGGIYKINNSIYKDPLAFGYGDKGLENAFNNHDAQISAEYKKKKNNLEITARGEAGYSYLSGILQPGYGDKAERRFAAAAAQVEYEWIASSILNSNLFTAFRYDIYSDAGSALSPIAGASIKYLPANLSLTIQYSYNFRPPSFNELYYLNYGSADLKPEKAHSANIGINWNPLQKIYLQANAFAILTNNLISAVPKSPVVWSAQNIGKTLNRGIELSAKATLFNRIYMSPAYTLQLATDETEGSVSFEKELVYTPKEIFSLPAYFDYKDIMLGASFYYTSYRYTLTDNSFRSLMREYWTLDLHASYKLDVISGNLKLYFSALNIFDKKYEVIINYPMPGRTYRGGITYEI